MTTSADAESREAAPVGAASGSAPEQFGTPPGTIGPPPSGGTVATDSVAPPGASSGTALSPEAGPPVRSAGGTPPGRAGHAIGAGVVAALVGFTSSFAVVLAGLTKMGATPAQAASGLAVVCVTQAVGMLLLAWRFRIPITLAWSTPGAALLASTGAVAGGWAAAIGAFVVTGVLIVLTGFWSRLGRVIAAIPVEIAQAMLAGVLVPLCLAPVRAVTVSPAVVVPVLVVWLLLQRFAARWAVLAAFATAAIGAGIDMAVTHRHLDVAAMTPRLVLTAPHWTWQAVIGVAVPLYIVTMAAQNIPGTAVLASFGYRVPWRAAMTTTGLGTIVGAAAGGHVVNLAAISAALTAAPAAHPDPRRRWIAALGTGGTYLLIAPATAALVTLVAAAPKGALESVAGLALLATLASALTSALAPAEHRTAAVVTFLVSASAITVAGIGAAFWALAAGLLVRWVLAPRRETVATVGHDATSAPSTSGHAAA
ncbi:benzoate/H(+) symporter BenE family transporter [Nocardia sp. alder85J]|uniref:benzoate/H(+) symporter BenE family transporter n=1 Tax=Nocardia sp. alder85J TaxID=2862949 RepID=UPI001CD5497A|nr:benzoate/H(+) symporter BenE family transporter [Nocardia sp. alder85J]MCX4097323.1 benzoate/H(+) symporter BenE family transporter [Nocardia sp. alder85J]